jgi:hypothetical protein
MSSGWCVQIIFMYRVYIFARFYVTVKVTFDLIAPQDRETSDGKISHNIDPTARNFHSLIKL